MQSIFVYKLNVTVTTNVFVLGFFFILILWFVPFVGLKQHMKSHRERVLSRFLFINKKYVSTDRVSPFPLWAALETIFDISCVTTAERCLRHQSRICETHSLNIMCQVGHKIGLIKKKKKKSNRVIMTRWCCINAIWNLESYNYDNFGPLAFGLKC